jgi:hypothetical protein
LTAGPQKWKTRPRGDRTRLRCAEADNAPRDYSAPWSSRSPI